MIKIYTDGSCLSNPGNGGWAAIINIDGKIKKISGKEKNTTNNRMELMATISALKYINSKDPRRIERGYNFTTPISEVSAGIEFNMLDFNLHEEYDIFSPYMYTGLSYSKFDEIMLQVDNLISVNKKNKSFGIPMIIGLKARFLEKFIFSIEGGARYVFSDDIDGNSSFNHNFGNINNNDWYFFSSLGISYTFGRRPCYCNIK